MVRGFPAVEFAVLPGFYVAAVVLATLEFAVQAFTHVAFVQGFLTAVEVAFTVAALLEPVQGVAFGGAGPGVFLPAKEPMVAAGLVHPRNPGTLPLRRGRGARAAFDPGVSAMVVFVNLDAAPGDLHTGRFPASPSAPRHSGADRGHQTGIISVTLNSTRTQLRTFPPP